MGKKTSGATVQGSYGDWALIENAPNKVTKVSCQMCHHYDLEDHSCGKGYVGPNDKIDRWKKCQEFILDPFHISFDVIERIRSDKSQKFVDEMLVKSKALLVDLDEYYQKKEQKKEVSSTKDDSRKITNTKIEENEDTPLIELEGQIYLFRNKKRCVIVSQDQKYYCLRFENGEMKKYDKKTLIVNHWLEKIQFV